MIIDHLPKRAIDHCRIQIIRNSLDKKEHPLFAQPTSTLGKLPHRFNDFWIVKDEEICDNQIFAKYQISTTISAYNTKNL